MLGACNDRQPAGRSECAPVRLLERHCQVCRSAGWACWRTRPRQPLLAVRARAGRMMSAILAQNAGLRTIARPKTTSRGPDETITAPAAFVSPLPFSAAMEGADTQRPRRLGAGRRPSSGLPVRAWRPKPVNRPSPPVREPPRPWAVAAFLGRRHPSRGHSLSWLCDLDKPCIILVTMELLARPSQAIRSAGVPAESRGRPLGEAAPSCSCAD